MSVSSIFGASPTGTTGSTTTTPTTYTSTTSTNAYGNAPAAAGNDTLNQADFLNLMTTQLENQDPTDPISDEDMASQMAQFSTLTGINNLNTTETGVSGLQQLSTTAGMIGMQITSDQDDSSGNAINGIVTSAGVSNGAITVTVDGNQVNLNNITSVTLPTSSSSSSSSNSSSS